MGVLAEKYRPGDVERSARELWAARGLPRPDGVIGRSTAPILRQFEGALITGDDAGLVAFRAVAADVDARYLALAGRRALGTLRTDGAPDEATLSLLRSLSVWTGGAEGAPVDSADRRAGVEAILGRMAALGLVVTRDTSLRVCPSCAQARTPERIIYQQEEGDTYLVRFPVPGGDGFLHALVWVDAPWRLLGASALLVSPTLPYVVARYRRRGVDEKILTSRPSLARLLEWLPGGAVEILEEGAGSCWQGRTYQYPLRHEFPMGGDLTPPSGTVLAVSDVSDSGTGIVPLVPGHGGTDAQIADRLGIAGWPLVTPRGQLDFNLAHKYSGLDIPTANEFIARDLGESGALFARLRVLRGVPHCASCGTALVWAPGRAWCLEPSRLPADRRDLYRRLLPRDPPVGQVEVAAWPISEPQVRSSGPSTVTLLECPRCERLGPNGGGLDCPCGNRRNPVSRRLLPSMAGALGAWARFDPFPAGDSVWLYLNERRRAPALVHHLVAVCGVPGVPTDMGLTLLPGVPEGGVVTELAGRVGADAVRAALVRGVSRARSGPTLPDRCRQEARRLERWWNLARETLDRCDPALLATFSQPIAGSLGELEPEDRAILARWERVRLATLADYDHQAAGSAHRRLASFLANDLETYFSWVRPRLDRSGTPPSRRAALRTLHHMLREVAVVLAPVSPHIAETVFGGLVPGRTSLFEASIDPLDSALLDVEAIKAWDRWASIERSVERFRRTVGLNPTAPIPSLAAVVASDELAARLGSDRPTIQRLTHVVRFEGFGPATPWTGRQRSLEPVLAEIQRIYPQEAGQIVHLLRRMPARRRGEEDASGELSVVVRGLSRKILPSMVEYAETVPERIVPVPWSLGELYAELPTQQPVPTRNPPPVSPDAFRLLARVERELRRTGTTAERNRGPVLIAAVDPLGAELRGSSHAIASYLGVSEVRVVEPSAGFPRTNCLFGRTRTGVHWWVRLPGEPIRAVRLKHRVSRNRLTRVRSLRPGSATAEVDFASEEEIAKQEQIRSLVQELDGVLGAPLLGPAKVAGAWVDGFRSVEDFARASSARIERLPGFEGPIAEALVRKLGGTVPPRSLRPRAPTSKSGDPLGAALPAPPFDGAIPRVGIPPAGAGSGMDDAPSLRTAPPGPRATSLNPQPADPGIGGSKLAPRERVRPAAVLLGPSVPLGPAPNVPVTLLPLAPVDEGSDRAPAETEPSVSGVPVVARTNDVTPVLPDTTAPSPDSSTGSIPVRIEPPNPSETTVAALLRTDTVPAGRVRAASSPQASPPDRVHPEIVVAWSGSLSNPPTTAEAGGPPKVTEAQPPSTSTEELSPSIELAVSQPAGPLATVAPTVAAPPEMAGPILPPLEEPGRELDSVADLDRPPITNGAPDLPKPPAVSKLGVNVDPGSTEALVEPRAAGAGVEPPCIALPAALEPVELRPERWDAATSPNGSEPADVVASTIPADRHPPPATDHDGTLGAAAEITSEPEAGRTQEFAAGGPVPESEEVESRSSIPPELLSPGPIPESSVVPLLSPTPSGGVRLVVAPSYLPAFARFLDATAAGHRGICIVRESPDRLRAHVGPRPVDIYWLTNIGRGPTLRPSDLDAYGAFLQRAVDRDGVTAFFLEGIEYLTRVHGPARVIEQLLAFHVRAQGRSARVWVYFHPNLLPSADLALFTSAFGNPVPVD